MIKHTSFDKCVFEKCLLILAAAAQLLQLSMCFLTDNVPILQKPNANTVKHWFQGATSLIMLSLQSLIRYWPSVMFRPQCGVLHFHAATSEQTLQRFNDVLVRCHWEKGCIVVFYIKTMQLIYLLDSFHTGLLFLFFGPKVQHQVMLIVNIIQIFPHYLHIVFKVLFTFAEKELTTLKNLSLSLCLYLYSFGFYVARNGKGSRVHVMQCQDACSIIILIIIHDLDA